MSAFYKQTLIDYIGGVKKLIGFGTMSENSCSGLPSFISDNVEYDDEDNFANGLCLSNIYIPEEVLLQILTFIEPKDVLKYSLVCRKWNKLIKSYTFWAAVYRNKYHQKAKKLPWYLYYSLLSTNYFDTNFIVNGNGQNKYEGWSIQTNGGDRFQIESTPQGADLLPIGMPEFRGETSCFATSYTNCCKKQIVAVGKNKLFRYILDNYKPHIYLSEWTAGRFDCGCVYKLSCKFKKKDEIIGTESPFAIEQVEQWQGRPWKKIELTVTEYPEGIDEVLFEHEGRDTQFWAGHYGSKMAGGVLKFLFETIEALPIDDNDQVIPKTFKEIKFFSNGVTDVDYANNLFPRYYRFVDFGGDYEMEMEEALVDQ